MNTLYNKYPFLFKLTEEKALKEFLFLRNYDYNRELNKTFKGNHASNFFFQYYRFNTKFKTRKNSPVAAWDNPEERKKIIERSGKFRPNLSLGSRLRSVFQLYYAPILQFKPIVACYIYKKFKPNTILDFSAGWGDRLLAAMVHNCNYIGIDTNKDLKKPYKEMVTFFKPHTKSKVKMYFKKAETVDYSKLNYDFVLTSPPYYDKETYHHMPKYKSYEDWLKKFLLKTVKKVFTSLKKGGVMGLHLPKVLYDEIEKEMGKCNDKMLYPKQSKNTGYNNDRKASYLEYIYFWNK